MSARELASQKRQHARNLAAVRGMHDQSGSGSHIYHRGPMVSVRAAAPPPVEQYDEWLSTHLSDKNTRSIVTGAKLRRMVLMRRNGETQASCGAAVGMTNVTAKRWLDMLPEGLCA